MSKGTTEGVPEDTKNISSVHGAPAVFHRMWRAAGFFYAVSIRCLNHTRNIRID